MYDVTIKCSECGKQFTVLNTSGYQYKIKITSKSMARLFPNDSICGISGSYGSTYQCSYTCYDHACLRAPKRGYITREKFIEYVNKSEKSIRAKGQEVRFPIDVTKFKEK